MRRVLDEREVVQHPDGLRHEVRAPAERVDEPAKVLGLEGRCHGVDREVAAVEILADRCMLDSGQGARRVVELRACRDDVHALVVAVDHDGRPELLVLTRAPAQLARDLAGEPDRVALDRDVDVEALLFDEDVPDGAADE